MCCLKHRQTSFPHPATFSVLSVWSRSKPDSILYVKLALEHALTTSATDTSVDTEVVSNSRVYVPGGANLFQSLVLPTILLQDGPLRSTILSLSSAERTRDSYDRVALHYKQRALNDLQRTLSDPHHAGENLMACVLQASLEIASGSRPAWLHHLSGSLAILKAFRSFIDDEAASFALSYFYLRYNLLRTTLELSPGTRPENEHITQLEVLTQERLDNRLDQVGVSVVDKHLGCSIELLSLISRISELSAEARTAALADGLQKRTFLLEHRLHNATFTCVDPDYEYLLTSAETFKLAARIYLRLVCWKICIQDEEVVRLQERLLETLACVLGETQPRRSFPMWPLFIAGCVSSQETHRKAVADMFTTINGKWPVSNISTVWRALQTIWKSRDLDASTADSTEHQDWQQVIEKFRWRLALT